MIFDWLFDDHGVKSTSTQGGLNVMILNQRLLNVESMPCVCEKYHPIALYEFLGNLYFQWNSKTDIGICVSE